MGGSLVLFLGVGNLLFLVIREIDGVLCRCLSALGCLVRRVSRVGSFGISIQGFELAGMVFMGMQLGVEDQGLRLRRL